jgi:hypothetical protein
MAVGFLGMSVAMLAVLVSARGMLLGLVVLPVGVMVGCLMVMVRGGVMVCSGLAMMFDGRVFGLLSHGSVLVCRTGMMGLDHPEGERDARRTAWTSALFTSGRWQTSSATLASGVLDKREVVGQPRARSAPRRVNSCFCERHYPGTQQRLRRIAVR